MKKTLLLAFAFAFVGLTGCASEETTEIDAGTDTTMVEPIEPVAPAPAPMDTTMMGTDTTMTGTDAGMGTGMEGDTAATGAGM